MEHQQQSRQDPCVPDRKGQKRKPELDVDEENRETSPEAPQGDARRLAILNDVAAQVAILNSSFSWNESDRAAAKSASHFLAELAKNSHYSIFTYCFFYCCTRSL